MRFAQDVMTSARKLDGICPDWPEAAAVSVENQPEMIVLKL